MPCLATLYEKRQVKTFANMLLPLWFIRNRTSSCNYIGIAFKFIPLEIILLLNCEILRKKIRVNNRKLLFYQNSNMSERKIGWIGKNLFFSH